MMRSLIDVRAAIHHLVAVLRAAGRFDEERPRCGPVDIEVGRFDDYLRSVRGLATSTRSRRRLDVREFLGSVFGVGAVRTNAITASDITTFVTVRPRPCRPGTLGVITVSVRSYLRFLRLEGRCPEGLVAAVPRVARWRLASIPAHLTDDEQHRFLASFDTTTRRGRRDYALALCMVILGLRAAEVASLRLNDVDWRDGRLHVPATKTCRSRDLPIPTVVGRALAAYLRRGRPESASVHLFLRIGVLEGEPMDSATVRSAVRLGYGRANLPARYTGTHRLRHTAATRLVETGAGVKEIADVLGHASLDSIAIYAKVNLPRLRAVALPWPGRSR
jgi:integrase